MGNRDHTTVIHGHDKINKMLETDETLKSNLDIIIKKLNPPTQAFIQKKQKIKVSSQRWRLSFIFFHILFRFDVNCLWMDVDNFCGLFSMWITIFLFTHLSSQLSFSKILVLSASYHLFTSLTPPTTTTADNLLYLYIFHTERSYTHL